MTRHFKGRTALFARGSAAGALCAAAALLLALPAARAEGAAPDLLQTRGYVEALALCPVLALLVGLMYNVQADPYIRRAHRACIQVAGLLVLSLIAQNYLEYRLTIGAPRVFARTLTAIYGYAVRPAILATFFYIFHPEKRFGLAWALIGLNLAVHLTALFSHLCFWISPDNHYHGGPLSNMCLYVSAVLFAWLFVLTMRTFYRARKVETWIPVFVTLLLAGSIFLDHRFGREDQPVAFLTIAVVISCVFYYIWLHLQFVWEREQALRDGQRMQIMVSQIQPHFLFNTLNTIRALCVREPKLAVHAIEQLSAYLRQNLESLSQTDLIPVAKELEHTRAYAEIEMLRFPNIHVEYDIRDDGFAVPALSIQPLVENAIRHGVRIRDEGRVTVHTRAEDGNHLIVIADNGKGFDAESAEDSGGAHIGIANVRSRVEQLCGGTLTIESRVGEGTEVTLRLPGGNRGTEGNRDEGDLRG